MAKYEIEMKTPEEIKEYFKTHGFASGIPHSLVTGFLYGIGGEYAYLMEKVPAIAEVGKMNISFICFQNWFNDVPDDEFWSKEKLYPRRFSEEEIREAYFCVAEENTMFESREEVIEVADDLMNHLKALQI